MPNHFSRRRAECIRVQTNLLLYSLRTFLPISHRRPEDLRVVVRVRRVIAVNRRKFPAYVKGESCVRCWTLSTKLFGHMNVSGRTGRSERGWSVFCVLFCAGQHFITSTGAGRGAAARCGRFVYCSRNVIKPERITIGGSTALPVQLHFDGSRMHF